jgi:small subunit ribosomal protein S17
MGKRKTCIGEVVNTGMDKTRIVVIERIFSHPRYKKIIRQVKRFKVHDEKNECRLGDRVKMEETRPISKDKRWRVVEIIGRSGLEAPNAATKGA